jgi:4'-phosphopantetheinyl transferase
VATIRWTRGALAALSPWADGGAVAWVGALDDGDEPPVPPNDTERRDAADLAPSVRAAFLRRRLALRRCVAGWTDTAPDAVLIANDAHRRPIVHAPVGPFTVSTASRGGVLAAVLSRHRVGIDVEVPVGTAEVATAVLTQAERRRLEAIPTTRREAAFLALWTAKEAYLKAIGLGLARDPAAVAIDIADGGAMTIADGGQTVVMRAAESRVVAFGALMVTAAVVVLA